LSFTHSFDNFLRRVERPSLLTGKTDSLTLGNSSFNWLRGWSIPVAPMKNARRRLTITFIDGVNIIAAFRRNVPPNFP
jgi:hypothetical protein